MENMVNGWDMNKERQALEKRNLPKEVIDDVMDTLSWNILDSFGTRSSDFGLAAHTMGKTWYNVLYRSNDLEWVNAISAGEDIGVFMDRKFGVRRRRDMLVKNALNKYAILRLQRGEKPNLKYRCRVPKLPETRYVYSDYSI